MALGISKAVILSSVLAPIKVILFSMVLDPMELGPLWTELGKKGVAKTRAFVLRMMTSGKPNKPQDHAASQTYVDQHDSGCHMRSPQPQSCRPRLGSCSVCSIQNEKEVGMRATSHRSRCIQHGPQSHKTWPFSSSMGRTSQEGVAKAWAFSPGSMGSTSPTKLHGQAVS